MKTQFARLARSICLALALGAGGAASAASGEATESSLPAQALTPRTLYHFLLAEIAGARGQVGLSAQLYLDLARSTRDPRIARRATEIAMYSRNLADGSPMPVSACSRSNSESEGTPLPCIPPAPPAVRPSGPPSK